MKAQAKIPTLDEVIQYLEQTPEDSWCTDVVRTEVGKNCVYGHLHAFGGNPLCDIFEEAIATTYMLYPVNDGEHPDYKQPTPKQRILAYIRDLKSGKQKTTQVLMKEEFEKYEP